MKTTARTGNTTESRPAVLERIRMEVMRRTRFLISSHARPDGDSIGSQLAMAFALRALGKQVRIVNRDPAPGPILAFPGVDHIDIAEQVEGDYDAAFIMECSELGRTGVAGFERYFLINIDHHPGNTMFGDVNWLDGAAAACGEMVFDVIARLGVTLTRDIATHIYLAILTDTGAFHYSSISARTFDICRQAVEAGVDPAAVYRTVFDSNNLGRLRLFGAVLSGMQIDDSSRLAVFYLDRAMARAAGATYEDTEGLINMPLTVKEIQAVVFFKESEEGQYRVSLRSKGAIDLGAVAKQFGGGGHTNASGCTLPGPFEAAKARILPLVKQAIEAGMAA